MGTQFLDWVWQKQFDDGSSDAWWGPLSITKLGLSVKVRSMYDEEFGRKWVGSQIIWIKP